MHNLHKVKYRLFRKSALGQQYKKKEQAKNVKYEVLLNADPQRHMTRKSLITERNYNYYVLLLNYFLCNGTLTLE